MSIDFSRIKTGDDFELLCRDVLKNIGVTILSSPAVGPDQGKDILIEVESSDKLGNKDKTKYVVQCKHFATSQKSVREDDIGDIRTVCDRFNVNGYFLITSTMPAINVATGFDAINKKGDYKTMIWDHKELESQIEKLTNSIEIINRYNLKDSLENIFTFVKNVLTSESALPFKHYDTLEEDSLRAIIYKQEVIDAQGKVKDEYTGYFCVDYPVSEDEITRIKVQHNLSELHVITDQKNRTDLSMTLDDFYAHIQSYKDEWYQSAIINLVDTAPINPAIIRLIEKAIKPLPYPPKAHVINFLDSVLEVIPKTNERFEELLVVEVCQAIAQLNIQSLKPRIFDLLVLIPTIKENLKEDKTAQVYLSTMTQRVISSFVQLESENRDYQKDIIGLFEAVPDLDYKLALLAYFKKFNIQNVDDELVKLKKEFGDTKINPMYHAISYNNHRIHLIENKAIFTVSRVIDDYFGIKDTDYGPLIEYDFSQTPLL